MKPWDFVMVLALVASTFIMVVLSGPDPDRGEHVTVETGQR